MIPVYKD